VSLIRRKTKKYHAVITKNEDMKYDLLSSNKIHTVEPLIVQSNSFSYLGSSGYNTALRGQNNCWKQPLTLRSIPRATKFVKGDSKWAFDKAILNKPAIEVKHHGRKICKEIIVSRMI